MPKSYANIFEIEKIYIKLNHDMLFVTKSSTVRVWDEKKHVSLCIYCEYILSKYTGIEVCFSSSQTQSVLFFITNDGMKYNY